MMISFSVGLAPLATMPRYSRPTYPIQPAMYRKPTVGMSVSPAWP